MSGYVIVEVLAIMIKCCSLQLVEALWRFINYGPAITLFAFAHLR